MVYEYVGGIDMTKSIVEIIFKDGRMSKTEVIGSPWIMGDNVLCLTLEGDSVYFGTKVQCYNIDEIKEYAYSVIQGG
jgi:hypothetical protein